MSLFVSNMYFPPFATTHNLFWKNMGGAHFVNVAEEQGVARCGWAWTGQVRGLRRLGEISTSSSSTARPVARGPIEDEATRSFAFVRNTITATPPQLREQMSLVPDFSEYYLSAFERSCLFWQKDGRFYDVAPEAGIVDLEEGQSAALVDFDNDGRIDVVVANWAGPFSPITTSRPAAGHWVGLELVGPPHMRMPFGAKVYLRRDDGKTPMREYYPANGFRGQSDPRIHFGLGAAERVPDIEVRWPDGRVEIFRDRKLDAYSTIRYGEGAPR